MASRREQQPAGGPLPLPMRFLGTGLKPCVPQTETAPRTVHPLDLSQTKLDACRSFWGARHKHAWLVCHRYARSCGKQASLSKLARQQTEGGLISSTYYPAAEQRATPEKATAPHIRPHTRAGCCRMGVYEGQHRLRHRRFARVAKEMD